MTEKTRCGVSITQERLKKMLIYNGELGCYTDLEVAKLVIEHARDAYHGEFPNYG